MTNRQDLIADVHLSELTDESLGSSDKYTYREPATDSMLYIQTVLSREKKFVKQTVLI